MAFKNYKEGTGVRARSDLTANVLPKRFGAISNSELLDTVKLLTAAAKRGDTIHLKPAMSRRLADILLETVNRSPDAQ